MQNAIRSPQEHPITAKAIVAGYFGILVVIPVFSLLNVLILGQISGWVFDPATSIDTCYPIQLLCDLFVTIAFSPLFSWAGAILSAPIVWLALRIGRFGWANAGITGLILFQVSWTLFIRHELPGHSISSGSEVWVMASLGALVLGLSFWVVVRLVTLIPPRNGRR